MKIRPAPSVRQRGVAVITALLLTTLAITIVASLFWQQQVQVRSIENQRLQLQQQWILRGALDWAGLILREDAKYSSVDNLDEPWAVSLAETRLDQYIESGHAETDISDATLSGSISDAQARYNLTNLCPSGSIDPAAVAIFARLLEHEKINPALAQATAEVMAATPRKPDPAADNNSRQSMRQPIKLTQAEDLLAVPGFLPEMLDKLKDFVIFLPGASPINVNTAPAEVLSAVFDTLTPADAAALVVSRNSASFRDLADLTNRLPGRTVPVSPGKVSVTTNYFLVNGRVHMTRAELDIQALIERNGATTKLIWIREI
ncbi:MAG: type II secretion system minor pseudopilin GspK [Pseudomonadota bacterium]